jgi:hypothetical protein
MYSRPGVFMGLYTLAERLSTTWPIACESTTRSQTRTSGGSGGGATCPSAAAGRPSETCSALSVAEFHPRNPPDSIAVGGAGRAEAVSRRRGSRVAEWAIAISIARDRCDHGHDARGDRAPLSGRHRRRGEPPRASIMMERVAGETKRSACRAVGPDGGRGLLGLPASSLTSHVWLLSWALHSRECSPQTRPATCTVFCDRTQLLLLH